MCAGFGSKGVEIEHGKEKQNSKDHSSTRNIDDEFKYVSYRMRQ